MTYFFQILNKNIIILLPVDASDSILSLNDLYLKFVR